MMYLRPRELPIYVLASELSRSPPGRAPLLARLGRQVPFNHKERNTGWYNVRRSRRVSQVLYRLHVMVHVIACMPTHHYVQ